MRRREVLGWYRRKRWHFDAGILARLRAIVTVLRGWDLEVCGRCGRGFALVWRIDDLTWNMVTGGHVGILCLPCFDALAARAAKVIGGGRVLWEGSRGSYPSCNGVPCGHEEAMVTMRRDLEAAVDTLPTSPPSGSPACEWFR